MRPAVISIVLLILFTTAIGATTTSEPNNTDSEIKFVVDSNTPVKWSVFLNRLYQGRPVRGTPSGPIRPAYAAFMRIRNYDTRFHSQDEVLNRINESPIAKKFSKSQQEFLKTGSAIQVKRDPGDPHLYYMTCFFAISEGDAELMARAYLDGLNRFAEPCASTYKRDVQMARGPP